MRREEIDETAELDQCCETRVRTILLFGGSRLLQIPHLERVIL